MNTKTSAQFVNASRRGVALVIVLSMLVLMSAVLVAFMGSVSSERAAQRAAYSGFEAQQAAESAVNLVISQIRSATQSDNGSASWASQPGAIRTFGGGRNMVYKLYSSDNMQESESSYSPGTPDESGYDPDQPKLTKPGFVDLNQPVLTPASEVGRVDPHYPIVDPRAGLSRDGRPAAPGKGRVEGFWAPQTNFHFSQKRDSNGDLIMEVPMRVRWLYQLKDGTMAAADRTSGEIPGAEKDNPPVARVAFWTDDETSKLNVNTAGENTYWDTPLASTKDESGDVPATGKLNMSNLGTTKRPPAGLGGSQPTQGEYQRYPGHPATTNLSPALRWLYPDSGTPVPNDWQFKEALYRLLPRIRGGEGSSIAGTRANDDGDLKTVDYRIPKRDRLFSSLDEFWFRPDRSPISDNGYFGVFRREGSGLLPDWETVDKTNPRMTPQILEQLRFFLTTNNRSPDLNAFGHPRVSIWPVHQVDNAVPSMSRRSGFDDLMAFCSSVSKRSYYFTRIDPWSTQKDLMESGTEAVDPLPSQPKRNQKLLFAIGGGKEGYLQRMGKKPIPGVGASLASKYSDKDPTGEYTEYERILLTMFDYIRSTNLIDTGRKDTTASVENLKLAYTPGYSTVSVTKPEDRYKRDTKAIVGSGQVIPSTVYSGSGVTKKVALKGFGRFVNLSEIGLLFYRDDTGSLPGDDPIPPRFQSEGWEAGKHYMGIRCVMLPEMWTVSPGYTALAEGYAYRVRETNAFRGGDPENPDFGLTEMRIAANDWCMVNVNPWRLPDGRFFMPTRAFNNHFVYESSGAARQYKKLLKPNAGGDASSYPNYPFYSKKFYVAQPPTTPADRAAVPPKPAGPPVKPLSKYFTFEGGEFEFEFYPLRISPNSNMANSIYDAPANQDELIQRVKVSFPSATLKVPENNEPISKEPKFQDRMVGKYFGFGADPSGSLYYEPQVWGMGLIRLTDVVRSVEFNGGTVKGDLRILAGLGEVPSNYFEPSGGAGEYQNKELLQIHNFRNSWGRNWVNAADGSGPRWGLLTPAASTRGQPNPGTGPGTPYTASSTNPEKLNKVPVRIRTKSGTLNAWQTGAALYDNNTTVGDFDRGTDKKHDGPFINKPDEGNVRFKLPVESDGGHIPYFRGGNGYEEVGQTYFSPNRLVSSPVMFGSLPSQLFSGMSGSGVPEPIAWQTLQFCPTTYADHKGVKSPPDHHFLDLFHMPVVEPYAISEPLSTNGRINLNSRLAPFGYVKLDDNMSYIQRHTGLYGVFKGMKQFLLSPSAAPGNSQAAHREGPLGEASAPTRFSIDVDVMMKKVIDPYLDSKKYFKYASEVCELDLPVSQKETGMTENVNLATRQALWAKYNMTGDNARERPYSYVYPRLTTKSNVFTVHVWAQSIAKNPASKKDDWKKFDDTKDRVLGEYRGSTTIERYIDADDDALVNYDPVENTSERGLDPFYRFRIVNQKRFTPQ